MIKRGERGWGIRAIDNKPVRVTEPGLSNGLACGCYCPECGEPLVAAGLDPHREYVINAPYFRHHRPTECTETAGETFEHYHAIWLLYNRINTEPIIPFTWECHHRRVHYGNLTDDMVYSYRETHLPNANIKPDIWLADENQDPIMLIEIIVKHPPELHTYQYALDHNIPLVGIHISDETGGPKQVLDMPLRTDSEPYNSILSCVWCHESICPAHEHNHIWCNVCKVCLRFPHSHCRHCLAIEESLGRHRWCEYCEDCDHGKRHVHCQYCKDIENTLHEWCDGCGTCDKGKDHTHCQWCSEVEASIIRTHEWCDGCNTCDRGVRHWHCQGCEKVTENLPVPRRTHCDNCVARGKHLPNRSQWHYVDPQRLRKYCECGSSHVILESFKHLHNYYTQCRMLQISVQGVVLNSSEFLSEKTAIQTSESWLAGYCLQNNASHRPETRTNVQNQDMRARDMYVVDSRFCSDGRGISYLGLSLSVINDNRSFMVYQYRVGGIPCDPSGKRLLASPHKETPFGHLCSRLSSIGYPRRRLESGDVSVLVGIHAHWQQTNVTDPNTGDIEPVYLPTDIYAH